MVNHKVGTRERRKSLISNQSKHLNCTLKAEFHSVNIDIRELRGGCLRVEKDHCKCMWVGKMLSRRKDKKEYGWLRNLCLKSRSRTHHRGPCVLSQLLIKQMTWFNFPLVGLMWPLKDWCILWSTDYLHQNHMGMLIEYVAYLLYWFIWGLLCSGSDSYLPGSSRTSGIMEKI